MCLKFAVWMGLGLYALLSATDWLMTFALLRMYPDAVETNPLASACLEQYGWNGLALYKFGGVAVVFGAVILLARRRRSIALGVVALGCAVLLGVIVYSHSLICESYHEAQVRAEDAAWPKSTAKDDAVPKRCWFAPKPKVFTATLRR
jgi:hypothetical protein